MGWNDEYQREDGVLCGCGRGVYAKSPVAVARGQSVVIELANCFIGKCAHCGSESFIETSGGKSYRYNLHGQSFWDRVGELVKEQWDSQLEASSRPKLMPVQEDQRQRA